MNRRALPIAGALVAAGLAGYLFGAANTVPAGPVAPVNVSVVHEESGELRSVELTDQNGNPVELGSVAEEFPWLDDDTSTP